MGETMKHLLSMAHARLRGFLRSNRGNVAMMFGIALVPMTIAAGVGLDYARSSLVKSQMSDALDAAALAVASAKGLNHDTAEKLAQQYFAANYKGDGTPVVSVAANDYDSNGSFKVTAAYSVPTMLLQMIGQPSVNVTTSTTVVWGQSRLWVSLVLDNSGSMANGDTSGSKMDALKNASNQLLNVLKAAASNAGDVKAAIIPFDRTVNVGTSHVNDSWIDWTDWEAPPPNVTIASSVGPGSNCPFTYVNGWGQIVQMSPYGYYCTTDASNSASVVKNVPSTGLICPGVDSGTYNTDHRARYYNGCWDSVPDQTKTVTQKTTTPITTKQSCTQTGSGPISCTNMSGYPSSGSSTTTSTTTYSSGYSGDSTNTTSSTDTGTTSDGSKSCSGNGSNKVCTWTRTISQTKTDTTVTKTAYGSSYTHTWRVNAHSTWGGCIMDRDKASDYDIKNTNPTNAGAGFPAANPDNCLPATVTPLSYDWTSLSNQINNMSPNASTNQAIGVAHGWMALTNSVPYSPGSLPTNTARYIIILSDGQNTQDRWWGNGSTEGTTEDGYIDAREKAACDNAKADGVVIYSIFLNVGGGGQSAPLSYCASDTSKYYTLTTTTAVVTTFNQIAQQITATRISR